MARLGYTAVLRDQLLRRDRDEHGGSDRPPAEDASKGDWTRQIVKARQILEDPGATDEERKAAGEWLLAHSGASQAPQMWEG